MSAFKDNLRYLRKSKNLTQEQLADYLRTSKSRIGMYETGKRKPDYETLEIIADFFNTDMNFLINGNRNANHFENKNTMISTASDVALPQRGVKIPVLGYVAAGIPMDAVEYIIDYEEIPAAMANTGEFFGLEIKGDSMEPRICSGDVVIVKKQPDVNSGDVAIVLVNGNEATCKKIEKNIAGISLVPFNIAKYSNTFYSNEEIAQIPITILGKVVELRAKF